MELHLKALVGEGGNFLARRDRSDHARQNTFLALAGSNRRPDLKTMKWENEFKCEDVANLADFSALVSELEALDPVAVASSIQ